MPRAVLTTPPASLSLARSDAHSSTVPAAVLLDVGLVGESALELCRILYKVVETVQVYIAKCLLRHYAGLHAVSRKILFYFGLASHLGLAWQIS